MTFRGGLVWLVLLAGCSPQLGRVLVTVVFENESRTQCIKASARNASGISVNASPPTLAREGKDTLRIGLGETADLVGEVRVTISRYSTSDCTGTAFASETKNTDVVRGAAAAMLEFRYADSLPDGGVDGGPDGGADGGSDAGCDVSACLNTPGDCEMGPALGCQTDGGCRFGFLPPLTTCSAGVCNSMGACIANVCSVAPVGTTCDDGLACTASSTCSGGMCQGNCLPPPECNVTVQPAICDTVNPSLCTYRAANDFSNCLALGSKCLDGGCVPWLQYGPANFTSDIKDTPYPTAAWNLASPDGGVCNTVVSTSGSTAVVMLGECGFPAITSTVNDAGVAVITTRGLDVGPGARLHFIGTRPVQLVVIGDASIRGVVSVAPLLGGQLPAGTAPLACSTPVAGSGNKKGGGGGGFGANGGNGGEAGGMGGSATSMSSPMRGGCPGANGFRNAGSSPGGVGGGALHLIVSDTLTMDGGVVTASGGGGTQGMVDNEGGGGGGSGGLLILEARFINLNNGAVTANGGGGGEGGANTGAGGPGALGPINSATGAPAADVGQGGNGGTGGEDSAQAGGNGQNGSSGALGGGGGGGSVGVVFIRASLGSCTRGNVIISGAQPSPISCMP